MKSFASLSACFAAATLLSPAIAKAQSVGQGLPLPVSDSANLGTGANPALGSTDTGTGVAFIDASGTNQLWDPSTHLLRTFPLALDPTEPSPCVWGGTILFCEDNPSFPPVGDFEGVYGYDFSSSVSASNLATAGTGLAPRGLVDAHLNRAVCADPGGGEVRLLTHDGTANLKYDPVYVPPEPIETSPTLSVDFVFYQSENPTTQKWELSSWTISSPHTVDTVEPGFESHPSDAAGGTLFNEAEGSIEYRDPSILSDPVSVPFDASLQGCSGYHDPKVGVLGQSGTEPDLIVVRGSGCPGEKLFAFNSLDQFNRAFLVGTLDATDPEFAVYEDQIAFVDASGDLRWLQVDMSRMTAVTEESEPNDSTATADPLLPAWIGQGAVHADTSDYWRFEAVAGTTYHISTSTSSLVRGTCDTFPGGDTYVEIHDASGFVTSAEWGNGYCGALDFTPTTSGTHYIRVMNSPDWGTTGTTPYYLTVDML